MSLKGDRYEHMTDISFFCNSVATRGGIVSFVTSGSGAAMDQSAAAVAYASSSSGSVPVGMLLNDVVNYDLTRQHINYHRDEVQVGNKVRVGKQGWWVTNNVTGTPGVGDYGHLGSSGTIIPVSAANEIAYNKANQPLVGQFHSTLDEDGYAKFYVKL